MTGLAVFTAVIVVLTVFCTFVRFGPFSITLALAPIVIGGAIYGRRAGAYLGAVFGLVVLITGFLGWDGGVIMLLFNEHPVVLVVSVPLKGIAAGWLSGLVYAALAGKRESLAAITAGIVCPLTNTGIFILTMLTFYLDTLNGWAAANGQNLVIYILIGLTGLNFLIEILVNIILSSGICRIISAGKKI